MVNCEWFFMGAINIILLTIIILLEKYAYATNREHSVIGKTIFGSNA